MLVQIPQSIAFGKRDRAAIGRFLTNEEPEQCRLPRPIAPNEAAPLPRIHSESDILEN